MVSVVKVQLEEKKAGAKVEHFMLPVAWIHRWQRFINSTSLGKLFGQLVTGRFARLISKCCYVMPSVPLLN